jgi:hypothetical protein
MKNSMKKILILVGLSLCFIDVSAQSHKPGTLTFQVNYDGAGHATNYTSRYRGIELSNENDFAGTSMLNIGAHYNVFKFLSLGADFGTGSYIENPENAEADGNKVRIFAFDMRFYLSNKDKFNFYIGPRLGATSLEINRRNVAGNIIVARQSYKYNSPHLGIYTGFNWYLTNFLGLNTQIGYTNHKLKMKSFELNGVSQNLTDFENILTTNGVHLQLGLTIKIN